MRLWLPRREGRLGRRGREALGFEGREIRVGGRSTRYRDCDRRLEISSGDGRDTNLDKGRLNGRNFLLGGNLASDSSDGRGSSGSVTESGASVTLAKSCSPSPSTRKANNCTQQYKGLRLLSHVLFYTTCTAGGIAIYGQTFM